LLAISKVVMPRASTLSSIGPIALYNQVSTASRLVRLIRSGRDRPGAPRNARAVPVARQPFLTMANGGPST
jgi:hypothetical protein